MFKNIGGKIKKLSEIVTWMGIITSVILGIIIMSPGDTMILAGLIVIVLGCFASWTSSFLLYGYGQLIENTDRLLLLHIGENDKNEPDLEQIEETHKSSVHTTKAPSKVGKCDICGKESTPVFYCTIKDDLGTRYRNMCTECMQNWDIKK
ncbi:MAG: hypothetical protein IJD45_06470 [Clostridia bacterium]|nr:hypothetical protein [Clostridia bacterium]